MMILEIHVPFVVMLHGFLINRAVNTCSFDAFMP